MKINVSYIEFTCFLGWNGDEELFVLLLQKICLS